MRSSLDKKKAPNKRGTSAMLRRLASRSAAHAASRAAILAIASLVTLGSVAHGATITKANNNTALYLAGSWTGGVLPAATDTVLFDSTITGPLTVNQGGGTGTNLTWAAIQVTGIGGLLTINQNGANNVLTLGTGGIDMSAATGDLTFNSGTIRFASANFGANFNVASGRTLTLNSVVANQGSNKTLTLSGAGNVVFNSAFTNAQPLGFNVGGANVTLNAANTFNLGTQAFTVASGQLNLGNAGALGGVGAVNLTGGTLAVGFTNNLQTVNLAAASGSNVTFASGIGTVNMGGLSGAGSFALADTGSSAVALSVGANNVAAATYSGVLSGGGSLTKVGTGTLTLSGANTYTGGTTVNGGTLSFGTGGSLAGAITLNNGTTLNMGAAGTNFPGNAVTLGTGANATLTSANLSNGFSGTVLSTGADATSVLNIGTNVSLNQTTQQFASFLGTVNVTGGLRFSSSSGAINNGGSSTNFTVASGGTISSRNAGTINLGSVSGSGTLTGESNTGGSNVVTYAVGNSGTSTSFSGVISNGGAGTTALTKVGASTLTLNGAGNSYSGLTTINAGTLNINGTYALGGANYSGTTFSGGTLQYTTGLTNTFGGGDISNFGGAKPVTISAGGATIDTNGNDVTYASTIGNSGTGGLTKAGAGTLTLQAASTYTGGTTVNAGTLALVAAAADGTGALAVNNGGTVSVTVTNALGGGATTLSNGSTVQNGLIASGGTANDVQTSSNLTIVNGVATLDFGLNNQGAMFTFTNANADTFGGILNIINYTGNPFDPSTMAAAAGGGLDQLFFAPGVEHQLTQVYFIDPSGNTGTYQGRLLSSGEVVAPEPSQWAALLIGALGLGGLSIKARRRSAAQVGA